MILSNIGMPGIGRIRETKKAVENFWNGSINESELLAILTCVRKENYLLQKNRKVELVPVFDTDPYDRLLRHAVMFGAVSSRFGNPEEIAANLGKYFSIPRGNANAPAASMTKWFNTNYHAVRPEIEGDFILTENFVLDSVREAIELGYKVKPALIGPLTFLHYSINKTGNNFEELFNLITPLYKEIIAAIAQEGIEFVQIEEPVLVLDHAKEYIKLLKAFYKDISSVTKETKIILQTYFGPISHIYDDLVRLPVGGIGMDMADQEENSRCVFKKGFPEDKWLACGIVSGRNPWITDLEKAFNKLVDICENVSSDKLILQPSSSLQHLPYSIFDETELNNEIKSWLAFGLERLDELSILINGLNNGENVIKNKILENQETLLKKRNSSHLINKSVRKRIISLKENDFRRVKPRGERYELQKKVFKLPLFPTTTIGSFPQTKDIRKIRLDFKKKKVSEKEYVDFLRSRTKEWIEIQEDIGLDVFVHGEFERSDMVAYFAEKICGMTAIQGWVQSYGTRYVRPPIIYGDISRKGPMTVEWSIYAQSLTRKVVKGILSGPITILNWSFNRNDLSKKEQAFQIALALRDEVTELVDNGIKIIQVDEPTIREGLPLKKKEWKDYLKWAIDAFLLATASAPEKVQIHTHMCFSDFKDIISDINRMDADVISIEDSKQGGRLTAALYKGAYKGAIGLGLFDVHSPRIPSVEEMKLIPQKAEKIVPKEMLWINPDCGLKTRRKKETILQLKNMVQVAKELRNIASKN